MRIEVTHIIVEKTNYMKLIFDLSTFRFNEYIDGERKRRLSQITNIPEHQIKVWFQNRRQKKKREAE